MFFIVGGHVNLKYLPVISTAAAVSGIGKTIILVPVILLVWYMVKQIFTVSWILSHYNSPPFR